MIYQRIWSRLKRQKPGSNSQPRRWNRALSERHISANALKVLSGLQEAGFVAYLVGGGVRDLLINKIPKDFDVATSASPEQVRRIFRNSRIIGRRFRLVHVFYRQEIIEVSTFRAQIGDQVIAADQHTRHANNTFGTVEEDAWRRDFTVNALYYCHKKRQVIDYTGGMEDLRQSLIRIIGDPAQRFHEDPVRLLRAIRLAAKLQFQIDPETANQVRQLPNLLQHVAESRLFDEMLKLFFTGHAYVTYQKLCEYNYLNVLFPQTVAVMDEPGAANVKEFIALSMQETDQRYREQNSLNPGFLLAVLLWPAVQKKMREHPQAKFHLALRHAIDEVLREQNKTLVIPHRLSAMMRAIWLLQYSLHTPRKPRVYRILFHRYFRAAFDFLALRVKVGEPYQAILAWWREFREADAHLRQRMLEELR